VTALIICRFGHFFASMLAFGISVYLLSCAPKSLSHALSPGLRRLTLVASVVALLSAILWLSLEAASMADDWNAAADPSVIGAVLTDTEFGHVWAVRLAIAVALLAAVALQSRDEWLMVTILSGLLLASLALVGHAAMRTGLTGVLQRGNHALHLLAAGSWLGGLVPFARSLSAYTSDDLRRDAVSAMLRFSFYGQFVVAALVLTGAVNVALVSGRPPFPPSTPYRALLDIKLVLVAAMIALALFNRFVVAPRLSPSGRTLALLRATSTLEVTLGTIVVALVSLFALLDPR
jgi:putative copper resistance protein D